MAKVKILKSVCHPKTGKPLNRGLITDLHSDIATHWEKAGICETVKGTFRSSEKPEQKTKEPTRRRRRRKKKDSE